MKDKKEYLKYQEKEKLEKVYYRKQSIREWELSNFKEKFPEASKDMIDEIINLLIEKEEQVKKDGNEKLFWWILGLISIIISMVFLL